MLHDEKADGKGRKKKRSKRELYPLDLGDVAQGDKVILAVDEMLVHVTGQSAENTRGVRLWLGDRWSEHRYVPATWRVLRRAE